LRVALTTAKGLSEATKKPAFGVSNLAALASFGQSSCRAPFFDARRGDIYGAFPDGSETVLPFPAYLAALPPEAELISFDFSIYPAPSHVMTLAPRTLAAAVASLAWKRYLEGERPDPITLDANYVRRSDAELHWREA
jgi:tRNA threonylcarbamoyladenosine biosynthesis protein TsaB